MGHAAFVRDRDGRAFAASDREVTRPIVCVYIPGKRNACGFLLCAAIQTKQRSAGTSRNFE
jgi:hypothetical protein